MLKRAAEESSSAEPPQKSSRNGVGAAGSKAEDVTNPIPRLFKQNSITIHISQRTFEELGPGELKWLPTSQYYAAMFDKFHYTQFMEYFRRCDSYTITDPKVRMSNLLMLQDDFVTQSGTPRDVSVFTQACYMISYSPVGVKNWFKLGKSTDSGKSQEILTYKPLQPTDGQLISQLVTIGNGKYSDFETLTLNPAKPDIYAGWHNSPFFTSPKETPLTDR